LTSLTPNTKMLRMIIPQISTAGYRGIKTNHQENVITPINFSVIIINANADKKPILFLCVCVMISNHIPRLITSGKLHPKYNITARYE
jgi:hypothetical protein